MQHIIPPVLNTVATHAFMARKQKLARKEEFHCDSEGK